MRDFAPSAGPTPQKIGSVHNLSHMWNGPPGKGLFRISWLALRLRRRCFSTGGRHGRAGNCLTPTVSGADFCVARVSPVRSSKSRPAAPSQLTGEHSSGKNLGAGSNVTLCSGLAPVVYNRLGCRPLLRSRLHLYAIDVTALIEIRRCSACDRNGRGWMGSPERTSEARLEAERSARFGMRPGPPPRGARSGNEFCSRWSLHSRC
jgi:hypothetical protein